MGKRGPAPKPQSLKVLQGTFRKDRAPKNAIIPPEAVPYPPAWLSRYAHTEWAFIVRHLKALKMLTKIDRAALIAYCELFAEVRRCTELIEQKGQVAECTSSAGHTYFVQRPEVGIRHKALTQLKAYLTLFGLSPSDRAKLDVPKEEKDEAGDFFFN